MLKVADAVALARPGLSLLHRSCLLQLQGKTPPSANRAQEGLEKVVWPEDEVRDQRLLLLPICSLVTSAVDTNNGNGICGHPALSPHFTAPPGQEPGSLNAGRLLAPSADTGRKAGQVVYTSRGSLYICRFWPYLNLCTELQVKMLPQGSAALPRLGPQLRVSHRAPWGELPGPRAVYHHHNGAHGPVSPA